MPLSRGAHGPPKGADCWVGRRDLLEWLEAPDPDLRRRAVRLLAVRGGETAAFCRRLFREESPAVRDALFTALVEGADAEAVRCLLGLLRREDPALRSGAVEALQQLPGHFAEHVDELRGDPDPQVRHRLVEVLRDLPHTAVPQWILGLVLEESDPTVCAAALDCLGEVGEPGMAVELQDLSRRFPGEHLVAFAAEEAVRRLEGRER